VNARCLVLSLGLALAALPLRFVRGSEFLADIWLIENGLPQNTVTCITQTRDGYLWLGTLNGLARFDGLRFVVFGAHNTPEIKSNRILCLLEDHQGGLWIGTEGGGVARLYRGSFATYTTWEGLPNNIVRALRKDAAGGVWLITQAGACAWRDGKIAPDTASQAPPETPVRALEYPAAPVESVLERTNGEVWAGTREGNFWRYRDSRWQLVDTPIEPGKHLVRCLFEDRERNLWVGTEGGGLMRLKERRLMTLDARSGLANEYILSMAEDDAGGVWLSANNGGISLWRGGVPEAWPDRGELRDSRNVTTLLKTSDGCLWAGTSGEGLYRWRQGETVRFGPEHGLPNPNILSLFEDREQRLWIGTYASGLFLYDAGRFRHFGAAEGFPARIITSIVQDRDGDIWIGSNGMGLYRYADGRFSYFCRRENWGSEFIRTLLVDREGALWIGSGGSGLTRMKDGWFHTLTTRQGLHDDVVSQILEDDYGYLWIGSNRGIFRLGKAAFEAYASGQAATVECQAYGKSEGLQSLECTGGISPACLKMPDGSLWFSTVKGAVRLEPERMVMRLAAADTKEASFNAAPPPVLIEEVFVEGEPCPLSGTGVSRAVTLRPGQKRLEIRYTAPSFTAPDRVRFKHRLTGLSPDWVMAGDSRLARYVGLAPGAYRFEVMARNNDGLWSRAPAVLDIRIHPHFWETVWFLMLAGCASAAGVAGIARTVAVQRIRRKLEQVRHQQALDEERRRIARDIHDDLGARLTRISLLSSLTERNLNNPAETAAHIGEIAEAVREVTQSLDEVVWAVEPGNDTLDHLATYLSQYAEGFLSGTDIRCRLKIPALLPPAVLSSAVRHDVFLVVKEALNNTAKHAQASTAWLTLSYAAETLTITVEDDGRGFDATAAGRGNGLGNMARRITRLGGSLRFEPRPGGGSRVAFSIPLREGLASA